MVRLMRRFGLGGGASGQPAGETAAPGLRFSVRSKFLIMMLVTSLLSLGTITFLAYHSGKKALTDAAINQLVGIRAAKKQQVEYYFRSMRSSFRAVADAPIIAAAIDGFTGSYRELGRLPLSAERLKGLEKFYNDEFLPLARKTSDARHSLEDQFPREAAALEAQALFIAENPNKIGEKSRLVRHAIDNAYTRTHATYHPWLSRLADRLQLYDVMLVDAESGTVVYTYAKEIELGRDMTSGPVAMSHLGQLIRDVMRSQRPDDVKLSDFAFYVPSANAPSAFVAAPVFKEQKFVGVIVGQISLEALSRFMHDGGKWREQGLGETGAVYLVGADMMMRSDTREIIETPDKYVEQIVANGAVPSSVGARIKAHKTTVLHYPIRNAAVRNALLGRSGTERIVNRRGQGALLSYAPLDIPDLNWVVIARMDEQEVLASQIRFNRNVMIAACTLALLSTMLALWLARLFLDPVKALLGGIERLRNGERNVVVASRTRDEFHDLVGAFNGMAARIKERDEVIEGKSRAYEQLLRRIFPDAIADRLKSGEATIAESFPQVTVVYAMIEGFDTVCAALGGEEAQKLLNEIVDRFDSVADDQGIEKIKTVGDHYLAAAGLSVTRLDHARRALEFARLAARELALVSQANGLSLALKVGVATGPAQAGLVGNRRFLFDIWGTAPSVARRIAYDADANAVRVNQESFDQLPERTGLGEELVVRSAGLGSIVTYQLRFDAPPAQGTAQKAAPKAAE